MWRHRAHQRSTPVKREAVIAGLASEGLALILGSVEPGSSAVVGPEPTDPVEFRKCARDLKALSAAKEHNNEERGGGRDPGVRRPGAGRGQLPARSKIFRAAFFPLTDRGWFGLNERANLLESNLESISSMGSLGTKLVSSTRRLHLSS